MVDHLVKEEISRRTVYNALNRRITGQSILCDTHLDPFLSWTSSMRLKLKRLANNRNEPIQVKQKILQESNNHRSANTKISY